MDFDSNLLLLSSRMCAYVLQPKTLKWDTLSFILVHTFCGVFELKAWLGINFWCKLLCSLKAQFSKSNPCAQIMFLVHSMMVLQGHSQLIFVVVCVKHLFIVGYYIHTKSCQTFWTQTLIRCRITTSWSSCLFYYTSMPCMPWIFQNINMIFF